MTETYEIVLIFVNFYSKSMTANFYLCFAHGKTLPTPNTQYAQKLSPVFHIYNENFVLMCSVNKRWLLYNSVDTAISRKYLKFD